MTRMNASAQTENWMKSNSFYRRIINSILFYWQRWRSIKHLALLWFYYQNSDVTNLCALPFDFAHAEWQRRIFVDWPIVVTSILMDFTSFSNDVIAKKHCDKRCSDSEVWCYLTDFRDGNGMHTHIVHSDSVQNRNDIESDNNTA